MAFKAAPEVQDPVQLQSASMRQGRELFAKLDAAKQEASLKELLDLSTFSHGSTVELSNFLTLGVHDILRDLFRAEGVDISGWITPTVISEPSLDKARSRLPNLMTLARENLVATITKNDKVDSAVALVDWRALELLCLLARKGLKSAQKFQEFAPRDEFSSSEAEELVSIDFHKPLPNRQTVAERRQALRAFSGEREDYILESEESPFGIEDQPRRQATPEY